MTTMNRVLVVCLVLGSFAQISYAALAVAQVEVGKPFRLDFGEGNFVLRRRTANGPPQFLFASPNQDGSWTTNGHDKIPSTAFLFFNGTLTFAKIADSDIGSYDLPLEKPKISVDNGVVGMVGPSQIDLVALPQLPPLPIKDPKVEAPIAK